MTSSVIEIIAHEELTAGDLSELRRLIDREYLEEFGQWAPGQPYGYASHDFHVLARIDGRITGHVGWAPREVVVGTETVAIAGGSAGFSSPMRPEGNISGSPSWSRQSDR